MKQKPVITNRQTIARSRLFKIESMDLEFINGEKRQYERLVGSKRGAVLIVGLLDPETLILIREYSAGVDRYELAFPKGKIDEGEDMLAAANRELQEETGYAAKKLTHLTSMTIAPGYLGHTTHIILAEDLFSSSLEGDEPEPLEVVKWNIHDTQALLKREDFTEARSIAAYYWVRDHVSGKLAAP